MNTYYFDNGATTKVKQEVVDEKCAVNVRNSSTPITRKEDLGFRVVRTAVRKTPTQATTKSETSRKTQTAR